MRAVRSCRLLYSVDMLITPKVLVHSKWSWDKRREDYDEACRAQFQISVRDAGRHSLDRFVAVEYVYADDPVPSFDGKSARACYLHHRPSWIPYVKHREMVTVQNLPFTSPPRLLPRYRLVSAVIHEIN